MAVERHQPVQGHVGQGHGPEVAPGVLLELPAGDLGQAPGYAPLLHKVEPVKEYNFHDVVGKPHARPSRQPSQDTLHTVTLSLRLGLSFRDAGGSFCGLKA